MKKLSLLIVLLFMGMGIFAQNAIQPALQFEAQFDDQKGQLDIIWNECLENSHLQILYAEQSLKKMALCKSNTAIDLEDLMPGTYTVKLDHYTGSAQRRFVKKHDGQLYWHGELHQLDIKVFPNPSSKLLTIGASTDLENARVSIIGLNGQTLQRQQLSDTYETIDISNLPQGIYYLRIEHSSGVGGQRFVKQ